MQDAGTITIHRHSHRSNIGFSVLPKDTVDDHSIAWATAATNKACQYIHFIPTMVPLPPGTPLVPCSPLRPASPRRPGSPCGSTVKHLLIYLSIWTHVIMSGSLLPSLLTVQWCPAQPNDTVGCKHFSYLHKCVAFPANERKGTLSSPSPQGVLSFLSHLYHPEGQREIPNVSGVHSVEKNKRHAPWLTYPESLSSLSALRNTHTHTHKSN